MKKIRLNKGLNLNKEVITKLNELQISNLKGGGQELKPEGSCILLSCDDYRNK